MKKTILILFGLLGVFSLEAQIDYTKAVGKTEGHYSVSETGAAVYEIPIYTPPGIKGMTPQLSLVYNSQSASGIAGKGWTLKPLSSITRQPGTIHTNGKATNIRFNGNDRFTWNGDAFISMGSVENIQFNALDQSNWKGGNLTKVGSDNYFSMYESEIENYCKIISNESFDNPIAFKVRTKNGMEMTFDDSDAIYGPESDKRFAWNLSRIMDENENEILFFYGWPGWTDKSYISKISYVGGKVEFEYFTGQPHIKSFFLGKDNRTDRILKQIRVFSGEGEVRRYAFEYDFVNRVAYLKQVTEYGLNNEQLNSTCFQWTPSVPDLSYFNKSQKISKFTYLTVNDLAGWRLYNHLRTLADADGDGKDEIIGVHENTLWVAKMNASGEFELGDPIQLAPSRPGATRALDPYGCRIVTTDVNDDGMLDIVQFGGTGIDVLLATGNCKYATSTVPWSIDDVIKAGRHTPKNNCFMADVNGDKRQDIVYLGAGGLYCEVFISTGTRFEKVTWPMERKPGELLLGNSSTENLPCYVFCNDINGDGLDDIVIFPNDVQSGWMPVFISTGEGFEVKNIPIDSRIFSKSEQEIVKMPIFMTDINGDGLADMVSICDNSYICGAGVWVSFSKGDGTFTAPVNWYDKNIDDEYKTMYHNMIVRETEDYKMPRIFTDIDGDGLVDMIRLKGNSIYIARNAGSSFVYKGVIPLDHYEAYYPLAHLRLYGDLNGDGLLDIIRFKDDSILYSTPVAYNSIKIEKITDGFDNQIEFVYNLAKDVVQYNDSIVPYNTFPFVAYKKNLQVTSKVRFTDESKSVWEETFSYADPVLHLHGRGFLGFMQMVSHNGKTKKTLTTTNQFSKEKALIFPLKQSMQIDGNTVLNEMETHYEILDLGTRHFELKKEWEKTTSYLNNAVYKNSYTYDSVGNITEEVKQVSSLGSPVGIFYSETTRADYENRGVWNFKPKNLSAQQWLKRWNPLTVTRKTNFEYYENSHLLKKKITDPEDTLLKVVETIDEYDRFGNPLSVSVTPFGGVPRTTRYEYDPTGRFVTQITNALGHVSRYEYNSPFGQLTKEIDPNGLETSCQYDNWGRLASTIYPDGRTEQTRFYWAENTLVPNAVYYTEKGFANEAPLYTFYDIYGREVCSYTFGNFYGNCNAYVDTRYNDAGLVVKKSLPYSSIRTTDSGKQWTEYAYDNKERLILEKGPYLHKSYAYSYDGQRGVSKVTAEDLLNRNKQETEYNPMGWVTRQQDAFDTLIYEYYTQGLPLSVQANGVVTKMQYDLHGNRTWIHNPHTGWINSTYNGLGEKLQYHDNGPYESVSYEYDLLGRLKKENRHGGRMVSYNYDSGNKGIGKLNHISGNRCVSQYLYDDMGRLSVEKEVIPTGVTFTNEYEMKYSYDDKSRLSRLEYPGGFFVNYHYDALGVMNHVSDSGGRALWRLANTNLYGQPAECYWGSRHVSLFAYNASGMAENICSGKRGEPMFDGGLAITLSSSLPAAENEISVQSASSRPVSSFPGVNPGRSDKNSFVVPVIEPYSCQDFIQNWAYQYDQEGKLRSRECRRSRQKELFSYDKAGRLTEVKDSALRYSQIIQYDSKGNISQKSKTGKYLYSPDQPHALQQLEAAAGDNCLKIPTATCHTEYNWFNRISNIWEEGEGEENGYRLDYNSRDQRNQMAEIRGEETVRTKTTPHRLFEIVSQRDSGSYYFTTKYYHYIEAGGRLIGVYISRPDGSEGGMYYIHTDRQGSYDAVTDYNGNIVDRLGYDAWGYRRNADNWLENEPIGKRHFLDRGYTGHEHLDPFGFINMNARLYDPITGQFFSPDELASERPEVSPYSYCSNDPVNRTDPTGLWDDEWIHNLETGKMTWRSNLGGKEFQIIDHVIPHENGGLLLKGTTIMDGNEVFYGRVKEGWAFSNVDLWYGIPEGYNSNRPSNYPYEYSISDLEKRHAVQSHAFKTAIRNFESQGKAEPIDAKNYWDLYGETLGNLLAISSFIETASTLIDPGKASIKGVNKTRFNFKSSPSTKTVNSINNTISSGKIQSNIKVPVLNRTETKLFLKNYFKSK